MVDITKAAAISGWMSVEELLWLAARAAEHKTIVEVGSYVGRSTRALGDHVANGGKVYAFDDWLGAREVKDSMKDGLFEEFSTNLADLIESKKVIPIKMDHSGVCSLLFDKPDMIFIDGDHSYENVLRDIKLWKPVLADGGLLCGHDIGWDGVYRATMEVFGAEGIEKIPDTTLWKARM
jgi:predicted O-methyltransferase YrrM